tara:strand:- start:364 stop:783 length:420 start_codon:yes stop_codon:yes gene_type:complete
VIDQKICCVEAFLIEEHDVYVDFDEKGMDEFWFDPDDPESTGLVSINNRNPPLTQLIILLHEAGHVIFRSKNNKLPTKVDRETIEGKMDVVHEEMMAWYEARHLSKQLGIKIKEEVWEENYCSSLLKYVKWVLSETEEN